jgi:hypothetical protein
MNQTSNSFLMVHVKKISESDSTDFFDPLSLLCLFGCSKPWPRYISAAAAACRGIPFSPLNEPEPRKIPRVLIAKVRDVMRITHKIQLSD